LEFHVVPLKNKPPIHLWIYNHPFTGISDQVEFFIAVFRQHGYPVSIGRQPSESSLNVVIENFSQHSRDVLINFCKSKMKRVAVIMTEHLNFESGQIFIHGDPLWSENDYMHPATQVNRIRYLFDCLPYIRCFLVLGDLPELRNLSSMLPGIDVRSIPFPRFDIVANDDADRSGLITNDLLFTGAVTDYRANILAFLKARDFSVACPQRFLSRKARDALNLSAKLILNIPQRANWRWLSLMRIVAGLRTGRATVSLGTNDSSRIALSCSQLDIRAGEWTDSLKNYIENWRELYQRDYENYMSMASEFEQEKSFPHDLFEYWSIVDRVSH
jgi:hypothetical protein